MDTVERSSSSFAPLARDGARVLLEQNAGVCHLLRVDRMEKRRYWREGNRETKCSGVRKGAKHVHRDDAQATQVLRVLANQPDRASSCLPLAHARVNRPRQAKPRTVPQSGFQQ